MPKVALSFFGNDRVTGRLGNLLANLGRLGEQAMEMRSVEASRRIWNSDAQLTTSERLVLLALASFANENFECCPGRNRLADMVKLSPRQLIRLLHGLRERGHIAFEQNRGGCKRTNQYRLLIAENGDTDVTLSDSSRNSSGCAIKMLSTVTSEAENGDISSTETVTNFAKTVTSTAENGDTAMSQEGFEGFKGEKKRGFESGEQKPKPPLSSLREGQPQKKKPFSEWTKADVAARKRELLEQLKARQASQ